MAANITTLASQLSPGKWEADPESPEESLRTFTEWVDQFEEWIDICGLDLSVRQKWGLLMNTGGPEVRDIVLHQAKIQIQKKNN